MSTRRSHRLGYTTRYTLDVSDPNAVVTSENQADGNYLVSINGAARLPDGDYPVASAIVTAGVPYKLVDAAPVDLGGDSWRSLSGLYLTRDGYDVTIARKWFRGEQELLEGDVYNGNTFLDPVFPLYLEEDAWNSFGPAARDNPHRILVRESLASAALQEESGFLLQEDGFLILQEA